MSRGVVIKPSKQKPQAKRGAPVPTSPPPAAVRVIGASDTAAATVAEAARGTRWPALVRGAAGAVLIAACALKLHQVLSPMSEVPTVEVVALPLEWALGAWLLSGRRARSAASVASLAFGLLAGVSLFRGLQGDTACGCFGRLEVSPWVTLAIDVLLAAALAAAYRRSSDMPESPWSRTQRALLVMAIAVPLLAAGIAIAAAPPAELGPAGELAESDKRVLADPGSWKASKPWALLPHADIGPKLSKGDWLVLLYHHDCAACRKSITGLTRALQDDPKKLGEGTKVALLEVPPPGPAKHLEDIAEPSFARGKLDPKRDWLLPTPVAVRLKDGKVLEVLDSGEKIAAAAAGGKASQGNIAKPTPTPPKPAGPAQQHGASAGESFDFGFVEPGSAHAVTFLLKNPGKQALAIKSVRAECECTKVEKQPSSIPAGGSVEIPVLFEAPSEVTTYAKKIFVSTDDKEKPERTLEIRAAIGLALTIEPKVIDLGEVPSGGGSSVGKRGEVTVLNRGKTPVRLLYSTSDDAACVALVPREPVPPGGKVTLPVEVALDGNDAAASNAGVRETRLQIHTDAPAQPTLETRVRYLSQPSAP